MAQLTDVDYALTLTAATSENVTAPKTGTMQLHLMLGLQQGADPDAPPVPPQLKATMSMPQFYTLLSTLEEARMALNSAADQ